MYQEKKHFPSTFPGLCNTALQLKPIAHHQLVSDGDLPYQTLLAYYVWSEAHTEALQLLQESGKGTLYRPALRGRLSFSVVLISAGNESVSST